MTRRWSYPDPPGSRDPMTSLPPTAAESRAESHLDPRWEWIEVTQIGDRERRYIKGRCNHLEAVPVTSMAGETVARLCLTCDAQLEVVW